MSINDYFLKMRSIDENLAVVGQVIFDDELLLYILASVGSEYDLVMVNLTSCLDSITLQEA